MADVRRAQSPPTAPAKKSPQQALPSTPGPPGSGSPSTTAPMVASGSVVMTSALLEKDEDIMAGVPLPGASPRKVFNYAKVTDKGYWTIEIVDILLRGPNEKEARSTGVCADRPNGRCTAIVDTGTYLIYGPQDQVTGKLGDVVVDGCDDVKKLPDIVIVLYAGEDERPARLTLHPHDYTLEFKVDAEEDCVSGIGPDNDDGWTFGQVFLRSFYTVFDRESDRIGFARSNPRASVG